MTKEIRAIAGCRANAARMLSMLSNPPRPASAFIIIVLIVILRRPDAVLTPQFWAEDAVIFFRDAFFDPQVATLLRPYGGYLHLVPRSVALATVRMLSPELAPAAFNMVAISIASACLWLFSLRRFRYLIQSDWIRFGAVCVVAVAHPAIETLNNITNVHYYMTLASLLLLTMPLRSWREAAGVVIMQIGTCLSAPFTIFLSPIALGVLFFRRYRLYPGAVAVLMSTVLPAVLLTSQMFREQQPLVNARLAQIGFWTMDFLRWLVLYEILGFPVIRWIHHNSPLVAWLVPAAMLTWLGVCLVVARDERSTVGIIPVFCLCAAWVIAPLARLQFGLTEASGLFFSYPLPICNRYMFLPYCLTIFLVARACGGGLASNSRAIRETTKIVAILVILSTLVGGVRADSYIDYDWRGHIQKARQAGWVGDIPINPPGWTLELRGRNVEDTAGLERRVAQ